MVDHSFINNLEYGVDKEGFIAQALQGYTGHRAIASELLQNADDARAARISFHFRSDMLMVRNDSSFSENDFANIFRIASGGKREAAGTIGTFGTGFVAVYHITDTPQVLSSGHHVTFSPTSSRPQIEVSDIVNYTELRLPWRHSQSELGQRIGSTPWPSERIENFRDEVVQAIYPLTLFLRHIRAVEVYAGDESREKLVASITREQKNLVRKENGITCEAWNIQHRQSGTAVRDDTWLYYKDTVKSWEEVSGTQVKDYEIAFAFPVHNSDWLRQEVPPRLYNFLPTEVNTGFGFQINGAFFPDNNRKGILDDATTQPAKTRWNRQVIASIGMLFSSSLVDVREQLEREGEKPYRFYELLPTTEPSRTYLHAINHTFEDAARVTPIIFSSLQRWQRPNEVRTVRPGSRLSELIADHIAILPQGMTQEFRGFLTQKLDVHYFEAKDLIDWLRPQLNEGQTIAAAHPMLNTREKLIMLYEELAVSKIDTLLADIPIFLSERQTLHSRGRIFTASVEVRNLFDTQRPLFLDVELQQHPTVASLLNRLIVGFRGAQLVEWLAAQADMGDLTAVPKDLKRFLHFIYDDLSNVNGNTLATLPIFVTEYPSSDEHDIYFLPNATERKLFASFGLGFIDPDWADDSKVREVYVKAGKRQLMPGDVVKALQNVKIDSSAHLKTLYSYFVRYRQYLSNENLERLKRLPLYLTARGQIVSAENSLYLPPSDSRGRSAPACLDKLELDHFVHSELTGETDFLINILGLKLLNIETFIKDIVLKYYLDARLDHNDRRLLFEYIRATLSFIEEKGLRDEIISELTRNRLLLGSDGEYHMPSRVYFASPVLDAIFGESYLTLDGVYAIPAAKPDDADLHPYRKTDLYSFLRHLGVNEDPQPEAIILAIQSAVQSGQPTESTINDVSRLYKFLNGSFSSTPSNGPRLKALADFAWLPAQQTQFQGWYRPSDIYQASHSGLVGDQAPYLPSIFPETSSDLRQILGMKGLPSGKLIAQNLLAQSKSSQPLINALQLYSRLGASWDDVPPDLRHRLKTEASIWDPDEKRYWLPNHVYLNRKYQLLVGRRRAFLSKNSNTETFYHRVGVQEAPTAKDLTDVLSDIALSTKIEHAAALDDQVLLRHIFRYLGEDKRYKLIGLISLRMLRIVPDENWVLHRPDTIYIADRLDLLHHFAPGAFPVVSNQLSFQETEAFLVALGVVQLSKVVSRRVHLVQDARVDKMLTLRVQERAHAFHRIAHHKEKEIPPLDNIEIFRCRSLTVIYQLNETQIKSEPQKEDALFVPIDRKLYVSEVRTSPYLQLARELRQVLFPDSDNEMTVLIAQLIEKNALELDDYLDQLQYKTLPAGYGKQSRLNFEEPEPDDAIELAEENHSDSGAAFKPSQDIESDSSKEATGTKAEKDSASDAGVKPSQRAENDLDKAATEAKAVLDQHSQLPASSSFSQPRIESNNTPPISSQSLGSQNGSSSSETNQRPENVSPTAQHDPEAPPIPNPNTAEARQETGKLNKVPSAQDANDLREATKDIPTEEQKSPKGSSDMPSKPPILSESPSDRSTDEEVPPFIGDIRSTVPVRGNDYGRLEREYGLKRAGSNGGESQEEQHATNEKDDKDKGQERVSRVRYILSYMNRYAGWLPLNPRAKRMLLGSSNHLRCRTDFEDWQFDLYIDRERGILYNKTELPRFLEAHNIPAGGIVYLERVHENTVRLFWKALQTNAADVAILELKEDGTVEQIMIPIVDIPCEIDDFVMRAEKRLEDPIALFIQAMNQPGILEIICDIFGEKHAVLTFEQVFNGVIKRRMVSAGSIYFHLSQRPCFVNLGDDRWRFEPERGFEYKDRANGTAKNSWHEGNTSPSIQSQQNVAQAQLGDAGQIASFFSAVGEQAARFAANPSLEAMKMFLEWLDKLIGEMRSAVVAPKADVEIDNLFAELWHAVEKEPIENARTQSLQDFLHQRVETADWRQYTIQAQWLLAHTPQEVKGALHLVLYELARQLEQRPEISASFYSLLHNDNANDFSARIAQLTTLADIERGIEEAQNLNQAERFSRWSELYSRYDNQPRLKAAIIQDLSVQVHHIRRQTASLYRKGQTIQAAQEYTSWLAQICAYESAWAEAPVSQQVWADLAMLHQSFCDQKQYAAACELIALYTIRRSLPLAVDDFIYAYWQAAYELSDEFAAGVLIDYSLFAASLVKDQRVFAETEAEMRNHAAALYKDVSSSLAKYHSDMAQYCMKRRADRPVLLLTELGGWVAQSRVLLTTESLRRLVNRSTFEQFLLSRTSG